MISSFQKKVISSVCLRNFVAFLVFLSISTASIFPSGFMPSFSGNGKVAIVICSGVIEKTILVDGDDGMSSSDTHQNTQKNMCPFAPIVISLTPIFTPSVISTDIIGSKVANVSNHVIKQIISQKSWHAQAPPILL